MASHTQPSKRPPRVNPGEETPTVGESESLRPDDRAPRNRAASTRSSPPKRGRPPKRVFINVLVRESTRAGLIRLKASDARPSQGEVIDELVVAELERRAARKG